MEGLITLNVARRRPDLVARAILNDIGPEIFLEGLKRIGAYLAKQSAAGGAPKIDSWESAAAYFKDRNGSCMPNFSNWEWFAKCLVDEQFRFRYDPAIALPAADPHAAPEWLWACLEATKHVLVIRGAISDILSEETARKMVQRGCSLLEVQGIGHTPLLTEPECKKAISDFLK
jgi:pimeloyl-ACP methyl ester carboxylesterase